MSPGEDQPAGDDAKTQEQTISVPDILVTSYLQIVDINSAAVAISSGDRPVMDAKHGKRRIYISVSSADDDDERLEDENQTELDTMRLDDTEDLNSNGNESISSKTETHTEQTSSKENDTSEAKIGPDADKPECVVLIEENSEQKAAFYKVQPNLMSSQSDEQRSNKQDSHEVENKAQRNSGIVDGEKLPNINDRPFVAVFNTEDSPTLSDGTEKVIRRHGEESEQANPVEIRPIAKRRRKRKRVTGGTHSDGMSKAEERMSSQDTVAQEKNGYVSTQYVQQLERAGCNGVRDFQQTPQRLGEQLKSSGVSMKEEQNDNEYQVANQVDQFANKARTNVPMTPEYQAESVSDGKMKPDDGKHDKYIYDYATTDEVTERNGSSSIVLQLRTLLQKKSCGSAQYVDRENKSTGGIKTVVEENKAHEKYPVEEDRAKTTDLDQGRLNSSEQIYANVDDSNDDLYCEIPATLQPEAIYANQDIAKNFGDEHSDNCPIYVNIGVQHGTVTCNGNLAVEKENGFAIYSNDVIDV